VSDGDHSPAGRVRAALHTAGRLHLKGEPLRELAESVDPSRFLDPLGAVDESAVEAFIAKQVKTSPRDRLTGGAGGRREAAERFGPTGSRKDVAPVVPLGRGKAGADEARRRFGTHRPAPGGDAA